jgi:hypothetical protein
MLEPTTGGLSGACRDAPGALPARIPRSRGADSRDCTDCTDGSVHELVHGLPQPPVIPVTESNTRKVG